MLLQELQKLLGVVVIGEESQSLLDVRVALLELALLVEEVGDVVSWLEQETTRLARLLEVAPSLVNVAFAKLKHTQIVE